MCQDTWTGWPIGSKKNRFDNTEIKYPIAQPNTKDVFYFISFTFYIGSLDNNSFLYCFYVNNII